MEQFPRSQRPCRWCQKENCAEVMHQILADQRDRPSLRPNPQRTMADE